MTKKTLTEQETGTNCSLFVLKESKEAWPTILKNFKDMFKEKFVIEDEIMASFDLALAAIVVNLQAVRNIFSQEQSSRIEKWILKCIDTKDYGEYALSEIKKYDEMFKKSKTDINNSTSPFYGSNPIDIVSICLLYKWLGKSIRTFEVVIGAKNTGVIDPILVDVTSNTLMPFLINWKKIKEDFDVIEGDLPLNYETSDLKDYKPDPEVQKPDGTIQYFDDNGNLKEKWLPPEQINEILTKGGAKRAYRVLIKGPWEGIKESYFELSDDKVKKFVDEKGFAYAICAYVEGKPTYTLTVKKLWEQSDKIEKIITDKNLTQEEQIREIKKLTR